MKVCIGGTFDIIHKGHQKLINKAFKTAGRDGFVFIGVAVDKLVESKKNVKSFLDRRKRLVNYIKKMNYESDFEIKPIKTVYGPTLENDFDAIIVSAETIDNAKLINKERKKLNKKPMKIIKIPCILAEDNKPISTTRIKKGDIDLEGNLI